MFMKGQMERDIPPDTAMRHADIEWRVNAIINDDSKKFAEELEEVLNNNTKEGFIVSSFLSRTSDNGLVVIQQRPIISITKAVEQDTGSASGVN